MEITHVGTETFHEKEIDIYLGKIQDTFWIPGDQLEMLFGCFEFERILNKLHNPGRKIDDHTISTVDENKNPITLYSCWAILKMCIHASDEEYISELIDWIFDIQEKMERIVQHVLQLRFADLLVH